MIVVDRRDLRDPTALGEHYLKVRRGKKKGFTINAACQVMVSDYASDEGPIEKYGPAGNVEPRFAEIQVA